MMQITKIQWMIAGIGIILIATVMYMWSSHATPGTTTVVVPGVASPTLEFSTQNSTSTKQVGTEIHKPFPINAADMIVSWNFNGAYAGNETLVQQANADIVHLTALIGKGKYDDYDLYNGIANDYAHLGNGLTAYQFYNRSISVHPKKGLAYVNLANLMSQLGAYYTAADAYSASVKVESEQLEYHVQRLTFLTERFANDNARILSALKSASDQFGDTAAILAIEAKWLTGQRRYSDAIRVWEAVKILSSKDRQIAIDTEIGRLKAKQ